jgi:hypothetical protein
VRFFDGDDKIIFIDWVPAGEAADDPVLAGEAGAPTK